MHNDDHEDWDADWPEDQQYLDCARCGAVLADSDVMCSRCGWQDNGGRWAWSHKPRWLVATAVVMVLLVLFAMLLPSFEILLVLFDAFRR